LFYVGIIYYGTFYSSRVFFLTFVSLLSRLLFTVLSVITFCLNKVKNRLPRLGGKHQVVIT